MDVGGNVGQAWTRVLHYRYICDKNFQRCDNKEQFYLANGFGLWQWKHFRQRALLKSNLMNNLGKGVRRPRTSDARNVTADFLCRTADRCREPVRARSPDKGRKSGSEPGLPAQTCENFHRT